MMTLSLMKAFYETVNPERRSPIADKIAARWLTKGADVKAFRASANFVFSVVTPTERFYLRFNHESERQADSIEEELNYLDHLVSYGVRVAEPVVAVSGNRVETVSTELGDFHAVLFRGLSGDMWEFDSLTDEQFELWGQALGKMHTASKKLGVNRRPSWQDHIELFEQTIPPEDEAAYNEMRSVKDLLRCLPVSSEGFGIIHFDFELDNLIWQNNKCSVLDFDECSNYWFEADIAFALRDLFDDSIDKVDLKCNRLNAFLAGYRSVIPIDDAAIKRIPIFLRLHNLISYARLIRSVGSEPDDSGPEWARTLGNRLTDIYTEQRKQFRIYPINSINR